MASKRVLKSTGQNFPKLLKAYIEAITHLHLHCNGIEQLHPYIHACTRTHTHTHTHTQTHTEQTTLPYTPL